MLAHVSLLPHYAKSTEIFISNGAYQLQSQAENQHILTTNPYYWAKEKVIFQWKYQKFPLMQICPDFDVVMNPKKSRSEYPRLSATLYLLL